MLEVMLEVLIEPVGVRVGEALDGERRPLVLKAVLLLVLRLAGAASCPRYSVTPSAPLRQPLRRKGRVFAPQSLPPQLLLPLLRRPFPVTVIDWVAMATARMVMQPQQWSTSN